MKILIADDHPIYAEGLRNLLHSYDYTVHGIVCNGKEAVEEAISSRPDVILMDLNMPEMDGIEATRQIARLLPDTRIIILTGIKEDAALFQALRAGASGYLLKDLDGEELKRSLEEMARGRPPFSPGLEETLLKEFQKQSEHNRSKEGDAQEQNLFSLRQEEILSRLASGETYKEIAYGLHLSERTVKYHIKKIKEILELETQAHLISYYRSHFS